MLTLKQLTYLRFLADALHYINNNFNKPEASGAVLYQLVIVGEIVAKQEAISAKLTDETRKLLTLPVCKSLQEIRDNFLVHSDTVVATPDAEKDIMKAIKDDSKQLILLEKGVIEIIVCQASGLFEDKIKQLIQLEDNRFSKAGGLITELSKLTDLVRDMGSQLDVKNNKNYGDTIKNVGTFCEKISSALRVERKKDEDNQTKTTHIDKLRKEQGFNDLVKLLSIEKNNLLKNKLLYPCDTIFNLMRSTSSRLSYLDKPTGKALSSPQIIAAKKEKITEQLKVVSDRLRETMGILTNSPERNDTLRYSVRWYIIVICALFEAQDISFDPTFKQLKNEIVHKFDQMDTQKETDRIVDCLPSLPTAKMGKELLLKEEDTEDNSVPSVTVTSPPEQREPIPPSPLPASNSIVGGQTGVERTNLKAEEDDDEAQQITKYPRRTN